MSSPMSRRFVAETCFFSSSSKNAATRFASGAASPRSLTGLSAMTLTCTRIPRKSAYCLHCGAPLSAPAGADAPPVRACILCGRPLPEGGVSDLCGPRAGQDFHIGVDEAAARSAAVVLAVLGGTR